jgi:hypothetical protein
MATVNGEPWASTTPRADTMARVPATLDTLDIFGLDSLGPSTFRVIHIIVRQLTGTGTYQLGFIDPGQGYYISYTRSGSTQYVTTSLDTGVISLDTLDMPTHRLSGTFHFIATVPSTNPEQRASVTNGHFSGHFEIK